MVVTSVCALDECAAEFKPGQPRQRFCKPKCQQRQAVKSRTAARKKMRYPKRRCEESGCRKWYRPGRKNQRFCKPECYQRDRASYLRAYQKANTETLKAQAAARYSANRQAYRAWDLQRKYGITPEEFEEAAKDGCQVCGSFEELRADHCHERAVFRGVLCNSHNLGLGHFKDDVDALRRAIDYLTASRAVQTA